MYKYLYIRSWTWQFHKDTHAWKHFGYAFLKISREPFFNGKILVVKNYFDGYVQNMGLFQNISALALFFSTPDSYPWIFSQKTHTRMSQEVRIKG